MLAFSNTLIRDYSYSKVVKVETSISDKGLPVFEIYGLITKSIDESKKRIITAFENSGISFPLKSIKVNLAPSEIVKDGSHFDFPIAVTILKYISSFDFNEKEDLFLGELSFNGEFRELESCFYFICLAKELGFKRIFIPSKNINKIHKLEGIEVLGVNNLLELIQGNFYRIKDYADKDSVDCSDKLYEHIIGNKIGKSVISYSLAGKHHLLLEGFPGSGKSMLIKSSKDLQPQLTESEALEVNKIHSFSLNSINDSSFYTPPFRSPHSSSSYSSIFGSSGKKIYPGEVALANKGILFLDEFPEFNRLVIEGLRSPLEDRSITISRTVNKTVFNTDFLLLATSNPCKCGYFNHPKIVCKCSSAEITKYRNRISGPILDRIDIFLKFDEKINLKINKEQEKYSYGSLLETKSLILKVREELDLIKNGKNIDNSYSSNSLNWSKFITQEYLTTKSNNWLTNVQEKYSLSNRKIFKLVNLALTISLFKKNKFIHEEDLLESLSFSRKE